MVTAVKSLLYNRSGERPTPNGARCWSRRAARWWSCSTRTASWSRRAGARARRSRASREGEPLPPELLASGAHALVVPYEIDGRRERLVYLSEAGDLAAYEELRAGFTAAVSHELRTPLARLLALLETALLPGEDVADARRAGARARSTRSAS